MRVYKYSFIFTLFFLSVGCEQTPVDTTPPTMQVLVFDPQPIADDICGSQEPEVFILKGGDPLSLKVLFEDNAALSQYKIDIHNNFDCHGHGGGSAPSVAVPNVKNQTIDWTVLDIQTISGTSTPVERTLMTPENVTAGNYHFHMQVIDESGNDSPFANFYSLKIQNPLDSVAPTIKVNAPTSADITTKKGESINFSGTVSDNRSLSDGGNGVLYLAYTDLSSGNTFTTDQVFAFDENVDTLFNFDFSYNIPFTLVTGDYRFSLGANDGVRNVAPFVFFNVKITN